MKERFIKLLLATKIEGMDCLVEIMEEYGFFTAPCSTKYHLSKEGGLLEHSMNVFEMLTKLNEATGADLDYTDMVVCGLLHDLGKMGDYGKPNSKTRRGRNMTDKSNCLQTSCAFYQYCGTVKTPIYEVKDGMITVKDKQYPIKLVDGYYIIRKLTVRECMRLQTVPEWYEFPVSNSQAYKMLGNGWTVDVITHLINSIMKEGEE